MISPKKTETLIFFITNVLIFIRESSRLDHKGFYFEWEDLVGWL